MIAIILRFFTGGLFRAIWKPVAWALGALGLYAKGTLDARQRAKIRAQRAYINRRKAMDNADDDLPDDIGVIRSLLRSRDPKQR